MYTNKCRVKVYYKFYPGLLCPAQHVTFTVRYDAIFLIKGNNQDEECVMPDDYCKIEDLNVCDDDGSNIVHL